MQERLHLGAGGDQVVAAPVDLPPVVHGVDHDGPGERLGRDGAEPAERQREHDELGAARGLLGRDRGGAGGQHVDDEPDPFGVTRPGDEHLVAGGDREPGQDGPEDTEHRTGHPAASWRCASSSRTSGATCVPNSSTARLRALVVCGPEV